MEIFIVKKNLSCSNPHEEMFSGDVNDVYVWLVENIENIHNYLVFRPDGIESIYADDFMSVYRRGGRKKKDFFGLNRMEQKFDVDIPAAGEEMIFELRVRKDGTLVYTGDIREIFYILIPKSYFDADKYVVARQGLPDAGMTGGYFCEVYYQANKKAIHEWLFDKKGQEVSNVNHPSHYNAYKGVEVIDLTEQMNFNRGNAVKYICRAGLKDETTEIEDLEKAAWYIQREIERLGGDPKNVISEKPSSVEESDSISKFLVTAGDKTTLFDKEIYRVTDAYGNVGHQFTTPFSIFDLTQVKTEEDEEKMVRYFRGMIRKVRGLSDAYPYDFVCGCPRQKMIDGELHACVLSKEHAAFDCTCWCGKKWNYGVMKNDVPIE